jgi:hypothetical protein
MSFWLITENGKIVSKTFIENIIRNDYLQADKRKEIDDFNHQLVEASLYDANFGVDSEDERASSTVCISKTSVNDDDLNSGVSDVKKTGLRQPQRTTGTCVLTKGPKMTTKRP